MSILSDLDLVLNELNMVPRTENPKIDSPVTLADKINFLMKEVENLKLIIGDTNSRQTPSPHNRLCPTDCSVLHYEHSGGYVS